MNLQEVLQVPIKDKDVLIIGTPASGKTFLSGKLKRDGHTLISCDDYVKYGDEIAYKKIMDDIDGCWGNVIVEGCFGYYLLLHNAIHKDFKFDIVIECKVSARRMNETYLKERDAEKIKNLRWFNNKNTYLLNQYYDKVGKEFPQWIEFENEY
jgi:uridine kinase